MCSHIFAVVLTASRELLRASTFILYLFEAVVALLVLDNWTVTSAIKATPAASASATKISAIGAFTSLLALGSCCSPSYRGTLADAALNFIFEKS